MKILNTWSLYISLTSCKSILSSSVSSVFSPYICNSSEYSLLSFYIINKWKIQTTLNIHQIKNEFYIIIVNQLRMFKQLLLYIF